MGSEFDPAVANAELLMQQQTPLVGGDAAAAESWGPAMANWFLPRVSTAADLGPLEPVAAETDPPS